MDSLEGSFLADLTGSLVSGLVCSLGVYSFAWAGQFVLNFDTMIVLHGSY